MLKNIIFDWSGTLCDDFELTYACNNFVHTKLGNAPMPRAEYAAAFELPITAYTAKLYPGIPQRRIADLYDLACRRFDAMNERVEPIDHARYIVMRLRLAGYKLFVFSAAAKPALVRQARALQLDRHFRHMTGGVSDKVAQLPEFMQHHGLNPAETLYLGDTAHDIHAGLAAGCWTAGILTGYGTEEQLTAAAPHAMLPDLEHLPLLLENINATDSVCLKSV